MSEFIVADAHKHIQTCIRSPSTKESFQKEIDLNIINRTVEEISIYTIIIAY